MTISPTYGKLQKKAVIYHGRPIMYLKLEPKCNEFRIVQLPLALISDQRRQLRQRHPFYIERHHQ